MTQDNEKAKVREVALGHKVIPIDELEWNEYRKRPVLVRAVQMDIPFLVPTLEGLMEGRAGDWLIEGVEGELYPCKDSVFCTTYKQAKE